MLTFFVTHYPNCQRAYLNENTSPTKNKMSSDTLCGCGGGERVRTDDLLRARQALSQLSYTPEKVLELTNPVEMVGLDGVEPSTSRLSGVRSNRTELQALNPC
jgi:hypothetical protein